MRFLAASACIVFAATVCAADWRDELTPAKPGKFPALRPLKATYKFGWGAISAASADFEFSRSKKGEYCLRGNAKTIGAVRTLWKMDSKHESYCAPETLRPVSLTQTETYKSKTISSRVKYDDEGATRLREVKPEDKEPPKTKRFDCPNVFDLQSGYFFVRSQSLVPGDRYEFVVYPAASAYLGEIVVLNYEKVKVAGNNYDAIKLEVRLQSIEKDWTLTPHKKFKQAYAWISNDRDRLLLKVKAEVFVGSVWAEMDKVEFAKE